MALTAQHREMVDQGDTTTASAKALAPFYADKPVVHVEAAGGPGTADRRSPRGSTAAW